jgi:DNA-directed RNA polymerase specialized sigma24 family protein
MDSPLRFRILDEDGRPLNRRVESALASLVPRLQRYFPTFRDDSALIDVLEAAGRHITHREADAGPIERLHAYAWVTLRNVATSRMRAGAGRIVQRTLASADSQIVLNATPARYGTAEDIERRVLLREVLEALTEEERLVCIWKKAGFSSSEIAARRGGSAASVDVLVFRIKQKVRGLVGLRPAADRNEPTIKATDAPRRQPAVRRPRD